MRWPPRIWYCASPYISFQGAAGDYRRLLGAWAPLVADPGEADIVVLHHPADALADLRQRLPAVARAYTVGYAVWEADALHAAGARGLATVDEVWTASTWCQQILSAYHPRVAWLPHVVRPPPPASLPTRAEARLLAELRRRVGHSFVYLAIYNMPQTRKNLGALLDAFARVRRHLPRLKLVLKGHAWLAAGGVPRSPGTGALLELAPDVLLLSDKLSQGGMEALWRLADVLVSPHHSEGWGLAISEAMVRGLPALASDYSGSRDFMTRHNSLLVACPEGPIAAADHQFGFGPGMRWGRPLGASLEAQMRAAPALAASGELAAMAARGARDVGCYAPAVVGRRLRALVADVVRRSRRPRQARRPPPGVCPSPP